MVSVSMFTFDFFSFFPFEPKIIPFTYLLSTNVMVCFTFLFIISMYSLSKYFLRKVELYLVFHLLEAEVQPRLLVCLFSITPIFLVPNTMSSFPWSSRNICEIGVPGWLFQLSI